MKLFRQTSALLVFLAAAVPSASGGEGSPRAAAPGDGSTQGPLRALVITGGHEHETSFYALFEGYEDLPRVAVSSSDVAFARDLRGKVDVIVMYDFTRNMDATHRTHLREFVESGGGVVVLHHALLDYQDWSWWTAEAVGGSYRLQSEGDRPSSAVKDRLSMTVSPEAAHPITRGLARFEVVDEAYRRMRFTSGITPLLVTDQSESDRVLAWIGPTAHYRVAAIQLGHGPEIFRNPSYRSLVHNAMLWAAGRLQ